MPRTRRFKKLARVVAVLGLGALVTGCAMPTAHGGNYVRPLHGALVTENPTLYSEALSCLRQQVPQRDRRSVTFAVGQITDATGKDEQYTGRPVTQGAALMLMSALSRAGMRQVERFDTSVAELELEYANNRLIGDGDRPYRQILAGQVAGSDYFIIGGVTELNFNIHSSSADLLFGAVNFGGRFFVMNVAADLRLVNSRTLEIVDVVSFQRQIVGRELRAGVFEFIGAHPLDVGVGERSQEPLHRGVRAIMERGALELIANHFGVSVETCLPAAHHALSPGAPGAIAPSGPIAHGGPVAAMDAQFDPANPGRGLQFNR